MINVLIKGPKFRTAAQLVGDGTFPVSQAVLLKVAKEHGVGRKLGRTTVFSESDIDKLYECLPCPSSSSIALNRHTGLCAAPSAASALKKAQALLTKPSPKK